VAETSFCTVLLKNFLEAILKALSNAHKLLPALTMVMDTLLNAGSSSWPATSIDEGHS
jgi:hypothetical protein